MAKRKKGKKAVKATRKKARDKEAAKSAEKETAAHKPTDDMDKAKSQAKSKPKPKPKIETPSDIEHLSRLTEGTQADKPADGSKEVDVGKSDIEIPTDKVEDLQKEEHADEVTEEILEAAAETERITDEAEKSLTEGQTDSAAGEVIEDADTEGSLIEKAGGDTQTDKSLVDIPESVTEDPVTTENVIEKIDDFQTDKPADGSKEADVGQTDIEIPTDKVEDLQKEEHTGEVTEEILEAAAETERLAEEAESLQIDDEQTSILVEVEEPDAAEGLSQDTEISTSADDVSGSVVEDSETAEIPTGNTDDTRKEDQPEDVNETSIGAAAETERLAEGVDSLQTDDEQTGIIVEAEDSDATLNLSQETEIDKSVGDESESAVEDSEAAENLTEKIDDTRTDDQPEDMNETSIEDPDTIESRIEKADDIQSDNQEGEAIEVADAEETDIGDSVVEGQTVVDRIKKLLSGMFRTGSKAEDSTGEDAESPETVANHIGEADYTRVDNQEVSAVGDNVEVSDDEIRTSVYRERKSYRAKKTGIIISVFIVTAAIILLIVASIERRSAKKALVQISKVAESVKQMQEEILKDREQVAHSQIESKELVIDALSLTRNGLELERANSDEVEVKKIIGVFINDIDERITKIKGDITLLRNKLKKKD